MRIPNNKLRTLVERAAAEKRRAVAPLMGFPGVRLIRSTVKIAQQNCREHSKAIMKLYDMFRPDIVFPLMDLSVEANALGFYTVFPTHETPTVVKSTFSKDPLDGLRDIDISFDARIIGYTETVRLMSLRLPDHVLKGAYVTGPFTLTALMIGADNAAMATLIDGDRLHELCEFAAVVMRKYTQCLIAAGADLICILEPSAVILGPEQFREFSAAYVKSVFSESGQNGVATVYHTCGNTMHLIEEMASCGVAGISLDSREVGISIDDVLKSVPRSVVVMGNISPTHVMLNGKSEDVRREVVALLDTVRAHPNFVLSTGCDLPFETPDENIAALIQSARAWRQQPALDNP